MSANNMKEDEKPMHKFEGLKDLLKRRGYIIEKAMGYKPIENKDVDLNDLRNNIEFTPDGIFLKDSNDGSKQQIFLYKRNYHLQAYGKPRFHIRQCQMIQSFINSGTFRAEYRRANTNVVKVRDMDDLDKDKDVANLPLCQFCLNMAKDAYSGMTTSDFVKILEQANEASEKDNDTEIDIFGYTKDWESVSRAYRELKEYRCDKCGVQITEPFDYYLMHVHHKDGDKTNNKNSNLRCLCIECHSTINPAHRKRFSSRANQLLIEEFRRKYR